MSARRVQRVEGPYPSQADRTANGRPDPWCLARQSGGAYLVPAHPVSRSGLWSQSLLLLAATALLGGCPDKPAKPTSESLIKQFRREGSGGCKRPPIELFLQADKELNPNAVGQSMPVEVRVLLLRDRAALDQLDFETVWQSADEALEDDLVSAASITVYPGKLKIHPLKSSPEVAYVGLIAVFREPKASGWRYVVDVSKSNRRCADADSLHTIVHAYLKGTTIQSPDDVPDAPDAKPEKDKDPKTEEKGEEDQPSDDS
jgi:type VI secretion system VasD/TssJ family lipoprotein